MKNVDLSDVLHDHILIFGGNAMSLGRICNEITRICRKTVCLVGDGEILEEFEEQKNFLYLQCNLKDEDEIRKTGIIDCFYCVLLNDDEEDDWILKMTDFIEENFPKVNFLM